MLGGRCLVLGASEGGSGFEVPGAGCWAEWCWVFGGGSGRAVCLAALVSCGFVSVRGEPHPCASAVGDGWMTG